MFGVQFTMWRAAWLTALLATIPSIGLSQSKDDLTEISLENLMNVQVSSVSRHLEELRSTAAAVYVITQDDIRRSGMTDIAELLRTVPGMGVAQVNSNVWAVSSRGFMAQHAKKMIVLVDGRSVYSATSGGVYWHLLNLVLE